MNQDRNFIKNLPRHNPCFLRGLGYLIPPPQVSSIGCLIPLPQVSSFSLRSYVSSRQGASSVRASSHSSQVSRFSGWDQRRCYVVKWDYLRWRKKFVSPMPMPQGGGTLRVVKTRSSWWGKQAKEHSSQYPFPTSFPTADKNKDSKL